MGHKHSDQRLSGRSRARTALTAEDEQRWREYLDRWEQEVYLPIFKPKQIGRDAALIAWAHWVQPFPVPSAPSGNL